MSYEIGEALDLPDYVIESRLLPAPEPYHS